MEPPPLANKPQELLDFETSPIIEQPPQMLNFKGVIDVDNNEASDTDKAMFIQHNFGTDDKGKGIIYHHSHHQSKKTSAPNVEMVGSANKVDSNFPSASDNLNDQDNDCSESSFIEDDDWDPFDEITDADDYSSLQAHFDLMNIPPDIEASIPWLSQAQNGNNTNNQTSSSQPQLKQLPKSSSQLKLKDPLVNNVVNSTILAPDLDNFVNFERFKQFDTVEDHSDHYYTRNDFSIKLASKNWTKTIQQEWKILEKDLPETIFVRVYESRMDLMRAVIIGADNTPYHDGLFFFDIFFPTGYPHTPPKVHYHSGGLRLNPNLYHCGKVCLSLLNTWRGNGNEMWIPGKSTMLQVLVSIQGLILNTNPYFNEPGNERQIGSDMGNNMSRQYNQDAFLLSIKTMVYNIRRPPKHFEDFAKEHFFRRAHDILIACKAYSNGAQVGSLVKGRVQDFEVVDNCPAIYFHQSLNQLLSLLVDTFKIIGVSDCEKFWQPQLASNLNATSNQLSRVKLN